MSPDGQAELGISDPTQTPLDANCDMCFALTSMVKVDSGIRVSRVRP
jgi:hypothetical protein